jgi:hypothetical protein
MEPFARIIPLFTAAATVDNCAHLLSMLDKDIIEPDHRLFVFAMKLPITVCVLHCAATHMHRCDDYFLR